MATLVVQPVNLHNGFVENNHFVEIPSLYHDNPIFTSRPRMMAPSWEHKDADPIIAQKAVEYIEKQKNSDQPFFLYLSPSVPHEPRVESVVPEFARGQSEAGPRGDQVWLADWIVEQVTDALEQTGTENTLIFVTSDNGALPGDRIQDQSGQMPHHPYDHKSCGHLRGYKAHSWEDGHREPFIARWPSVIKPETSSDQLMCSTDLMATCAAIVGTDLPENTAEDSHNILPVLTGSDNNNTSVSNTSFGFWRLFTPSSGMEIDFGNSRIRWLASASR